MAGVTLKTVRYRERPGKPLEWSLDCLTLGQINLLVGKNATGKTRALNIITWLARIFRGEVPGVPECGYDATFSDAENRTLRYVLNAHDGKIIGEYVYVNDEPKLKRDGNTLELLYEETGKWIAHEPSEREISAVSRKDKKQHPFLLPFHDWAQTVRNYHFGSSLGQGAYAVGVNVESLPEINDYDENMVVGIFRKGKAAFPDFVSAVMTDMKSLGYSISDIDAGVPDHMQLSVMGPGPLAQFQLPAKILAMGVREDGIAGMYFQDAMSQGMFRALSVLVQVHYSQMSGRASCIVIDDIGEGLDFERSSRLIEILRKSANKSSFQLIISTNDQFVMNLVPLDEWSVLQRIGNHVSVMNVHNSRAAFEDFRFVGLNNFAFFEMDFTNQDHSQDPQLKLEGIPGNE